MQMVTGNAAQAETPFGQPSRAVLSGWAGLDGALTVAAEPLQQGSGESGIPSYGQFRPLLPPVAPSGGAPPEGANGGQKWAKLPVAGNPTFTDTPASGLVRGGVHEWFGAAEEGGSWTVPLLPLAHLAARAVADAESRGAPSRVLWIGRQVWPYPRILSGDLEVAQTPASVAHTPGSLELRLGVREARAGGIGLLEHSLFVDPGAGSSTGSRAGRGAGLSLWAIDTALRCPGVTAIVADGSGLDMAATRRLQLAAASASALVLLARPPSEAGQISAATTRWSVSFASRDGPTAEIPRGSPLYRVRLLRAKGRQRVRSAG